MENNVEDLTDIDLELSENFEQIGELLKVEKRTPEQEESLRKLKQDRGNLSKQRIAELTKSRRSAEAERDRLRQEKEELERQLRERREEKQPVSSGKYEKIKINGKEFYTEDALAQMVQDGKMTQNEAWAQQKAMIKEEAKAEMKDEFREESTKTNDEKVRQETIQDVLKEYPKFNPSHPEHNPNDPLYKEASRLLNNGYMANPRGIRLAIEDAKKILGIGARRPDLSDDLSVSSGDGSIPESRKEKKMELSDFEIQQAKRLYVFGGKINPATGKVYTEKEAVEKALKAKQDRSNQFVRR